MKPIFVGILMYDLCILNATRLYAGAIIPLIEV